MKVCIINIFLILTIVSCSSSGGIILRNSSLQKHFSQPELIIIKNFLIQYDSIICDKNKENIKVCYEQNAKLKQEEVLNTGNINRSFHENFKELISKNKEYSDLVWQQREINFRKDVLGPFSKKMIIKYDLEGKFFLFLKDYADKNKESHLKNFVSLYEEHDGIDPAVFNEFLQHQDKLDFSNEIIRVIYLNHMLMIENDFNE